MFHIKKFRKNIKKVNKGRYTYLYGVNFKRDLDEKGYATMSIRDSETDKLYVGDISKVMLAKGEKKIVQHFKSNNAYNQMVKHEKNK